VLDYTPDNDGILFDFVTLVRDASVREGSHTIESWPRTLEADPSGGWSMRSRRSLHFAMPPAFIKRELENAGFTDVRLLGSHAGAELQEDTDESLIVVATRA
jgi:predicted RNA binding protein YcfA (HicA-like mRNA interferase family)